MGLDPPTLTTLSPLLHGLARANAPRLVLALRPQDPLPDWITHVVYLGPDLRVALKGPKETVFHQLQGIFTRVKPKNEELRYLPVFAPKEVGRTLTSKGIGESALALGVLRKRLILHYFKKIDEISPPREVNSGSAGEALVEMEGVQVKYGEKQVLGGWKEESGGHSRSGLWWTVRRGERWGVFGPNGNTLINQTYFTPTDSPQDPAKPPSCPLSVPTTPKPTPCP